MSLEQDSLYISTLQAAQALGVSVSSIKRWVDEGVLPAHRTAGGHRKLLRSEVLVLARQKDLPLSDLALLCPASGTEKELNPEAAVEDLCKALLDGRGAEVSALIRRLYSSGVAVETLADRLITPALAKIGHDWETSRIDVWQEHRATQLCAAALYDIMPDLEARAEQNRPVAVGGAPEGDPYFLPTLLAQYVLLDAGWEAINLGPNTPLSSLKESLQKLRPRLIWLSVSFLKDSKRFLEAYRDLYQVAEDQGVAIAIGGQALATSIRASIPYTTHGDGLSQLAAFARTLHPRPKLPRRGRPRQSK